MAAGRAREHSAALKTLGFQRQPRELLPPRGFDVALPAARERCIHLTAELALTSKRSAASRRDEPASTASITRSRKSWEQAFGMIRLQKWNQCR
jgi:hypothetical protein